MRVLPINESPQENGIMANPLKMPCAWREWTWAAATFVGTLALYLISVNDGCLALDDWGNIYGCPFVKDGLSLANVRTALVTVAHGGIWMPATFVSFMADISIWGAGWRAHHAVNAVLHAANAVLAMRFLLALLPRFLPDGRRASPAWCSLAALAWACAPSRADAVAWVVSRKEELWTLFALAAALSWISWLERGGRLRLVQVFAFFALSCLSKPTAMCFPVLAWLVQAFAYPGTRRRACIYLPMLAASAFVALLAVAAHVAPAGMARFEQFSPPFSWRTLNAVVSLGLYVLHSVVPFGIYADCRAVFDSLPIGTVPAIAALAVALAALAWMVAPPSRPPRVRRAALFAALWFLAALAPVLWSIGEISDNSMAERYLYMPAVAVAFAVALALALAERRLSGAAALCAGSALVAVNATFAVPVILSYADDVSLARRTLCFDPGHWRAQRTIGSDLAARQGRVDEGIALIRKSLATRPSQATADMLAYLLACRGAEGDFNEVRHLGAKALVDHRADAAGMMLEALAIAAFREGRDAEAARLFADSLVAPVRTHSNVHAMLNLGFALANSGDRNAAVSVLSKLCSVSNDSVRRRAADAMERIHRGDKSRFMWE